MPQNKDRKEILKLEHQRFAQYYDLIFEKASNVFFYKEYAKKMGGPILELACGTGRILIPIAKLSYKVVGLDLSQAMLDVFAAKISKNKNLRKTIQLVCGDMANFNLGKKFNLIFISNSSFFFLNSNDEKVNCLRSVAKHLTNKGICIIDYYPYSRGIPWTELKELEHENAPKIFFRVIFGQKVAYDHFRATVIVDNKKRSTEYKLANYYLRQEQIRSLIERAGLKIIRFLLPGESKKYLGMENREIFILGK